MRSLLAKRVFITGGQARTLAADDGHGFEVLARATGSALRRCRRRLTCGHADAPDDSPQKTKTTPPLTSPWNIPDPEYAKAHEPLLQIAPPPLVTGV